MRSLFKVVAKALIFDRDHKNIITIHMNNDNIWGLPGGHIEEGESPDETIVREINEECGLTINNLKRCDFFIHENGKVVLAYIGEIDKIELKSNQNNLEGIPKWISKEEFMNVDINKKYHDFVLDNWK